MKSLKLLIVVLIAFPVYAMNPQFYSVPPQAKDKADACGCSRWESLGLKYDFLREGQTLKERSRLLNRLVEHYTDDNLPLIRRLLCANKRFISRKDGALVKEFDGRMEMQSASLPAFETAVATGNLKVASLFCNCFNLTKGFKISADWLPNLGINYRYNKTIKLGSLLGNALKQSEQMTKLLIEGGVNPLHLDPSVCTKEPGCDYFKKAYQKALSEKIRKEIREVEFRVLRPYNPY